MPALSPSPLANRAVLITGGTGSFGQAFARHALDAGVRRLVILSRDELKQAQLRAALNDPRVRFFVGDVRDRARLDLAFRGIDVVIHAAAMKRIETCEADPGEAIATNITGTQNVALAAISAGVQQAVFLSTDKAPVPHTLYGMTKAVAERLWIASNVYAAGRTTRLSCTRYGNVLGSRGSVLGLWRRQREAGEPLTLTDERMTRYWMTLDDAVQLVVTALTFLRGGEIFVPKAGSSTILDLARVIAMPDGVVYQPGHVCTGLRPGERLHETLISADEARHTYDAGDFYVIEPDGRSWGVQPPLLWPSVPEGWSYRSDTNREQLSLDQLRRMVA